MNFYELDYKLTDTYTSNHSNDGYTRDKNLKEVFVCLKDKIKKLESNMLSQHSATISILQAQIGSLQTENATLKSMLVKMALKDYPELVFENPQFFESK